MKIKNLIVITSLIVGGALFTGCASDQETVLVSKTTVSYENKRVDVFSDMYRLGIKNGCKTAKGYYEKDYYKFNSNSVYKEGWYAGMKQCRQRGKFITAY